MDSNPPITLVVRLEVAPTAEELYLTVSGADESSGFSASPDIVTIRLWRESFDVIRASIRHPRSGTVAMIQGNNALEELARCLDLKLERV